MTRISIVENLSINNIDLGSTLLVGDLVEAKPRAYALAVRRDVTSYYANEGNFSAYALFTRPIPQPVVVEPIHMYVRNEDPFIKVKDVAVISISASSIMQIGSNRRIDTEARVKQFRQLKPSLSVP